MSGPWTQSEERDDDLTRTAHPFDRSLHRVLDNIRDYAIFMMDTERRIVGWNAGAERILGYSAAEILHTTADAIFTDEDRASGAPAREQAVAARDGRAEDERWHVRKSRSRFYASGVLSRVTDAEGRIVGFVKVLQDFTERRRTAEALARSEERYRLLVDSVKDYAIFMLDPAGRVVSWTAAAERLLGYAEAEVLGQSFALFFTAQDRAKGVPDQELSGALVTGRVAAVGWRVRKDGTHFWGEELATAVRDGEGRIQGVSKITRDITQRMVAEEERERLLRQMTEANRIKDEFLGTVSHELRTPLNSILGWTRLLRDGNLTPESSERALETIQRNALAQARLIDDLLDVSRIITGQLRLHLQEVNVPSVLTSALNAVRPAADAKEITVEVDLSPDAESLVGDAGRLQQILWNLLANAIKFTPAKGSVRVETRQQDTEIVLTVADTGVGIEPEFLPFVFDRFRQADSTTTRTQSGLGLGLAIVRHLAELHGGRVAAQSAGIGRGATFTVVLPRHTNATTAAAAGPFPDAAPRQPSTAGLGPQLQGISVLVVEDDEDAREFLRTALHDRGATVFTAAGAQEGWDAAIHIAPDVLVADIGMPVHDGYRLIHEVRSASMPRVRDVPAIAVTAYARDVDRARVLAAGYQEHLAKPIDADALASAILALTGPRPS
jgi:PAS domain S-box-containing protein